MTDRLIKWAVTSGSYSDYRVHAVFDSKETAEKAASLPNRYESYSVEAIAYRPDSDDPAEMVTTYDLSQEFRDDGTSHEPSISVRTEPWFDQLYQADARPRVRFVRAPVHKDRGGRLEVRGTDRESVMKVAGERKAQLLANCDQTGKVGPEVNA